MKIAISSDGKGLDSQVSGVFGRCRYFLIVRLDGRNTEMIEAAENRASNQSGKAGISAAELVAEKGIDAVISGDIGPRAMDVLRQFGIKAYKGSGSIKRCLGEFAEGGLDEFH